jgi:AraC family carnitine catabolism transcriptional activator
MSGSRGERRVTFFLVPKFSMMAFACALEPLRVANRLGGGGLYRWTILSRRGEPVPASNGLRFVADGSLADAAPVTTLIVCAGFEPQDGFDAGVQAWLRRLARPGATLGALDTGSFFLGWAGLLDGYRATTHWESLDSFREQFPKVEVTSHLFEVDRTRLTCGGGTGALDMMLYLIQLDHGYRLATAVSEQFLHVPIRDGRVEQRMTPAVRHGVTHPRLGQTIALMEQHLDEPLSLAQLRQATGLSLRQLERLFRQHFERTPTRYYLDLRLERARTLLEYSDLSILQVAVACGFASLAHFSRTYRAWAGRSPREERRRAAATRRPR